MDKITKIKQARPEWSTLSDSQVVDMVHQLDYRDLPKEQVARALGVALEAPKQPTAERKLFSLSQGSALNDVVTEFGNAVVGGVSSAANFVAPGNRVSGAIDKFIADSQDNFTPTVKQGKQQFEQELQQAEGLGEEAMAALRYAAANPGMALAQAAGSFVGPGAAIKGSRMLAKGVGLAEKAVTRAGLAAGSATGAAMAGGDAAGTAYDLVIKAGGTPEQAQAAAREASLIPAAIGGVGGLVGAERVFAGAKGFTGNAASRALKTGAVEGAQEGIEEGVTQYEGQRAAVPFDPTINPMKGVGGAATMGAVLGGATGGGISLLEGKVQNNGPLSRGANLALDQIQRETQAARPGAQGLSPDQEAQAMSNIMAQGDADMKALKQAGFMDKGPSAYANVAGAPSMGVPGVDPLAQSEQPFDALADRIMATRETLADEGNRQAIREKFGQSALDEVLYYLNQADKPGQIPDKTRDNMLAMAEEIVSRSRLTPMDQPGGLGAGAYSAPERLGADVGVPQIGLDTEQTGVFRADAAGNVAPETNADRINTRQAQDERSVLGAQARRASAVPADPAPKKAAPPAAIGYDTTPTGVVRVDAKGEARHETRADRINAKQALPVRDESIEPQARRASAVWADSAPKPPAAPKALPYDTAPTGRMVAGADGVAVETQADRINREAARSVLPGDRLNPSGAPFKNKRAAMLEMRRVGGNVVEVRGGWVVRATGEADDVRGGETVGSAERTGADGAPDAVGSLGGDGRSPADGGVAVDERGGTSAGRDGAGVGRAGAVPDGSADRGIGEALKGKTPAFLKTKTVPEMTDEELKEAQAFYGPNHKRAKTIQKEMAKRAPKRPSKEAKDGDLPLTDIRLGDKVSVDGESYTVTGPIKEGRKTVGIVADRDSDIDPLKGVKRVMLRGDEAVRARIAAENQPVVAEPKPSAPAAKSNEDDKIKNAGGFVIPEDTLFKEGDGGQSPWLMKDGKVIGTGQDHISFADAMMPNGAVAYDDFMRATGAIRAAFFVDAEEGYVATLHTHAGQSLSAEQLAFMDRLSKARGGELSIMLGQADGLVNPTYMPVTLADLRSMKSLPAAKTANAQDMAQALAEAIREGGWSAFTTLREQFAGNNNLSVRQTLDLNDLTRAAVGVEFFNTEYAKADPEKAGRVAHSNGEAPVPPAGLSEDQKARWLAAWDEGKARKDDQEPAARQAGEVVGEAKEVKVPKALSTPDAFEHAGLMIRPSRVKVGEEVKNRWIVQSPENAEREARGERQIGGDRIVDTREQAIQTATQEVKRFNDERERNAEMDRQEKARKEAEEQRKASNRGKTITERRADAVLDKQTSFPASAGLGTSTKRQSIEMAVEQGRAIVAAQVPDTAAKKRDQATIEKVRRAGYMLGLSNENIPLVKDGLAARDRLKADDYKTTEYRVYSGSDRNGSFWEITKTEYDYAQSLTAKAGQAQQDAPQDQAGPGEPAAKSKAEDLAVNRLRRDGYVTQEQDQQAATGAIAGATAEGARSAPAVKQAKPSARIEDIGEKIGGARKDVWTSFKDDLNAVADGDIANQPLSKIWPAPDYQKLIDDGMDAGAVALVRSFRDEIPAKPRATWKVKRWAEQVKTLREFANDLLSGSSTADQFRQSARNLSAMSNGLLGRADLYLEVGHGKSLEGIRLVEHHYTLYRGRENVKLWAVERDAAATAFSNWPQEIATGDTKEQAIEAFKGKYATLDAEKQVKKASFDVISTQGKFYVAKKVGRNYAKLAGPFATVKEARDHRLSNLAELEKALESYKEIPKERRDVNEPRVGEDMRNGQDVTPDFFAKTFGFRGVEFGNWVEQSRRQKDLNDAFDALMDMAAVLGLPPKAISLNGELGLAFGARGGGGVGAAAAHYEHSKVVINLTKKEGAGSLGHEWWHAVDNYFSRMRKQPGEMMTTALDVSLASRGSNFVARDGVRKEMVQAFGKVVSAIKQTAMKARAARLDSKRSKEYWTTGEEMSARAFESYLIAKLQDQQASNDYLANVVDQRTWDAMAALGVENDNSYPYPTADEIPAIREGFDQFFQAVQTRENDAGDVVMFSRQRDADGQNTAEQNALKALSENDDLFRLPKSDGMTVEDITADNDPGIKVKKLQGIPGRTEYQFTMPNGKTARMVVRPANPYGANTYGFDYVDGEASNVLDVRPGDNPEDVDADKEDVWIDVSLLSSGQDGARIYNIASTYAHNTGRIFIGDPAGLSDDALIRRPEQMLSSALKFGTTEHLAPHPRQITGDDRLGVPSLQWVYGDHIGNIKRLIDVNLKVAENAGLDEITFDPTDGSFRDSEGGDLGREGIQALAEGADYGRAAGAGASTLARGAVLRALLREGGEAVGRGDGRGRDGLLARLVSVSAAHEKATHKVFYSREGVDQPETGEGFRRQDAIAAIAHMDMVEDLVRQLTDGWKNAPEIVVLRSMEEAPEAVRRENDRQLANGATGEPEAFYHQGKAYLLASHMRSMNDVRRAVFHEVLGHLGMRGLYGTEIGEILDQVARARRADVEAKAKQYGLNMKNARDRQIAAEEWLAEIAQDNPHLGFVRRAVAAIRSWLRRNVPALAKMRMTDDEIVRELIAPVQRFIKDGPPDGGTGLIPAFRRDGGFSRAEEVGFSRTQAAQEFTGKAREAVQDFFGSAGAQVDWLDRTFKTQYAKAQKFPQFGRVFNKVQDYIEGISTLANQAADNAPSILPKLEGWRDLAKTGLKPADAKAVAAPLFEGTLEWTRVDGELVSIDDARADGFEGEAGVVFTDAELRERFGLNDSQVASYREFRAAVDESLDQLVSSEVIRLLGDVPPGVKAMAMSKDGRARLRQAIAEAFENQDDPLLLQINDKFDHVARMKARGYAPLSRFGKYWVHVVDKSGETLYFGLEESAYRANRLARTLRDEFDGATVEQGKMSQEFHKLMSAVPVDAMELFASAIGADQSEVFQKYIQLAKNNRSTMKRLIKRKGTSGFSEDVPRVLASFVTSNARAASTALNIKDAKDLAGDIRDGDIKDEAIKLIESVTEPEESGAAIRGVMFTNFIGGSIASAVVNITQPFMMTLPYLSQWGGAIKAGGRLVNAARLLASGVDEASDIGKALKRAENEGIVSPQEIHHLIARASGGIGGRNLYLQKLALLWSGPFSVAEQFNRQVSFLAAYQTAQAEGMADPFGFAEKAVIETQGLYNCVDPETECLTASGWKRHNEMTPGEPVYAVDEHGLLVESKLIDVHRHTGPVPVINFSGKHGFSMVLTPNHDVIVQTYSARDKRWQKTRKVKAVDLKNHQVVRVPLGDAMIREAVLSDDEVAFLSWVAAEGSLFAHRGSQEKRGVQLVQSKSHNPVYVAEIRDLLNRLGYAFNEYDWDTKDGGQMVRWRVGVSGQKIVAQHLPGKQITMGLVSKLTTGQMRIFLHTFCKADGHFRSEVDGGGPTITQKCGKAMDVLQAMAVLSGSSSALAKVPGHDWHRLYLAKASKRAYAKHLIATKDVAEMVWCPQTEHGTWIARRNGRTFVTGNSGNKPNWARGPIGATAMTFKQYSIHYLEWLARMAKSGPDGKKAAVLALALLVMAAGSDGLPFMDDLDDVFDTVGQAMGYDTNTKRARREMVASVLGEDMAEVATRGFSAAGGFPVDLSIRMGMGNLLPATDLLMKSNTDTARSLAEIAGPGGAMFTQYVDAVKKVLSGDIGGAVQKVSPVALQNLAKAAKMAETGEYRDQRDRKVTDVDITDAGMKALSFQPARIARESTRMSEARQSEMLAKSVENEITDKWARAIVDGDKEAEREALKMRDDWNEKNPDQPIVVKRTQAVRKARNMKMERRDRFIKSVAPERRALVDKEIS